MVYYERKSQIIVKKDGGKIMIIIIITAIASLMTLDYIDTKEAKKSAKLYEIVDYKEDNDEEEKGESINHRLFTFIFRDRYIRLYEKGE